MVDNNAEGAAGTWVNTIGHANIAKFGGIVNPKPFWNLLQSEFYDFVCNDQAYKKEKEELAKQGGISKALLVSSISSAIGAKIGVVAALISPAILLLLFMVGSMSINAFCKLPRPNGAEGAEKIE